MSSECTGTCELIKNSIILLFPGIWQHVQIHLLDTSYIYQSVGTVSMSGNNNLCPHGGASGGTMGS